MTFLLLAVAGCGEPEPAAATEALSARILLPLDAQTTSQEPTLIGLVQGSSDDALVWWESDLAGILSEDVPLDEDGICYSTGALEVGEHEVWLFVEDGDELVSDSVSFTVTEQDDTAPEGSFSVEVLSPASGVVFPVNSIVTFQGQVTDADLDLVSVGWTSSLDGELYIDEEPDGTGLLEGSAQLSEGTHTVTLSATVGSETNEDSIVVTINGYNVPPGISINLPSAGSTFDEGDQVYLKATVSDTEDAPEELQVIWSSSIDGTLTTTFAEKDGTARSYSTLSVGSHTLTAQVVDTGGETSQANTTVTVE